MKDILIPRNIERRHEKLRQYNIQLLSQEVIEGDLIIDESFEGIPDELVKVNQIYGDVSLYLDYIPSWLKNIRIEGYLSLDYRRLTSLENCPQYVKDSFYLDCKNLKSLDGMPTYIGGDFKVYNYTGQKIPNNVFIIGEIKEY